MPPIRAISTLAMIGGAAALLTPCGSKLEAAAAWFARPARLPFAWQALTEAQRGGVAAEAFARGQQILSLLPSWTTGHAAFAYRYVLTQDTRGAADAVAEQAERRLRVALTWLEQARADAGARELDLLHSAAFLAPIACRQIPGLEARLPPGGAAAITDACFAEAERRFPSAAVREQRLFHFPTLAAALLDAGQRPAAAALLREAADRALETRDQDLAREWQARVTEVARHLEGEPAPLDAVFADARFAPLWPHLR